MTQISRLMISKKFSWGSFARVRGSRILISCVSSQDSGMDDLKPSILMGKLKHLLPPGVSPDNDLFRSMFLIKLPPSIREEVDSGDHKAASAMVSVADALWDAPGGHNPTVAVTMTHRSRSPAPAERKKNNKRGGSAHSKICSFSSQDLYSFQNPGNSMCKYHNYYGTRAHKCVNPCTYSENYNAAEPLPTQWIFLHMPQPQPCISLQMLGLIFLPDELSNTDIWLTLEPH
jgi:hypothetical protein